MKSLLVVLLCFAMNQAFAEEIVIAPKKTEVEEGSSAYARINKENQFLINLTGAGPNATASTGLIFGHFIDRNSMFLVEAMTGTNTGNSLFSSSFYSSSIQTSAKAQSIGVHFKQFVSNSFYYRFGVDYRNIAYKYSYTPSSTPVETAEFNGDSVALNFQIGNQWQFEKFTLGCDWFGLSMPITSNTSSRTLNAAAQTDASYYNRKLDDESDYYTKRTTYNFVRFYLGSSF